MAFFFRFSYSRVFGWSCHREGAWEVPLFLAEHIWLVGARRQYSEVVSLWSFVHLFMQL